jgi:hypothetical protein
VAKPASAAAAISIEGNRRFMRFLLA